MRREYCSPPLSWPEDKPWRRCQPTFVGDGWEDGYVFNFVSTICLKCGGRKSRTQIRIIHGSNS